MVEEVPRMEAMAERIQPVQKPALGTIMTDSVQHERKIVEKQHIMNSCYILYIFIYLYLVFNYELQKNVVHHHESS